MITKTMVSETPSPIRNRNGDQMFSKLLEDSYEIVYLVTVETNLDLNEERDEIENQTNRYAIESRIKLVFLISPPFSPKMLFLAS